MVGCHRYVSKVPWYFGSKVPSSCSNIISLFRRTTCLYLLSTVLVRLCVRLCVCPCVCVCVCVCVYCIIIFLRYLPLDHALLLGRYLLPAPVPPPFLHQQSARALQHLVSPHDLRLTPWHKSVRTLFARPFQISLILFQSSYISVT